MLRKQWCKRHIKRAYKVNPQASGFTKYVRSGIGHWTTTLLSGCGVPNTASKVRMRYRLLKGMTPAQSVLTSANSP